MRGLLWLRIYVVDGGEETEWKGGGGREMEEEAK